MKNTVVVNAVGLSALAGETIMEGKSSLQRVVAYARRLPDVSRLVLLTDGSVRTPPSYDAAVDEVRRGAWSTADLISALREAGAGCDNLVYVYADCPLLDAELSRRMLDNHCRYFADYTFADGYPYGLTPEILRSGALASLAALAGAPSTASGGGAEETPDGLRRESIFGLISRDINAFDIETEISPEDLRHLRVSLTADTRRNFLLVRRLADLGAEGAESVCRILREHGEILRTLPAFFNVQVVEGVPRPCAWSPYSAFPDALVGPAGPGKAAEMPPQRFAELVERIERFCGDAVIGISLWGEVALHDDLPELAAAVTEHSALRLVVETSGVGWREETLSGLEALAGRIAAGRHPDWIVTLDAWSPEVYRRLHGEGYDEAGAVVQRLLELFPGRVHVQAVRMKENEEDLETFYREWKKTAARVIIQKYDSFCGRLPDRRVTDLSPLKRFPCWHLKRDVNVLLDGTVPLCREDLSVEHGLGNIFTDGLERVWAAQERYYLEHLKDELPPLCRDCDEYYTFNF